MFKNRAENTNQIHHKTGLTRTRDFCYNRFVKTEEKCGNYMKTHNSCAAKTKKDLEP